MRRIKWPRSFLFKTVKFAGLQRATTGYNTRFVPVSYSTIWIVSIVRNTLATRSVARDKIEAKKV